MTARAVKVESGELYAWYTNTEPAWVRVVTLRFGAPTTSTMLPLSKDEDKATLAPNLSSVRPPVARILWRWVHEEPYWEKMYTAPQLYTPRLGSSPLSEDTAKTPGRMATA